MARLRAPDGCPWDREQTPESLKRYIIEEAYELCDAIDSGDSNHIKEELGDLLFQVIFQAQIANEEKRCDMQDVVDGISDKMENRHPHVFGDETYATPAEVNEQWEKRKAEEKGREALLSGIPSSLPALQKAHKVSKKAARVGFDWPSIDGPLAKIDEEIAELNEARKANDPKAIEDEFGDVLFAMVNLARFLKVDPEAALRGTVQKFIRRFTYVETETKKMGRTLEQSTIQEMEALWNQSKRMED